MGLFNIVDKRLLLQLIKVIPREGIVKTNCENTRKAGNLTGKALNLT